MQTNGDLLPIIGSPIQYRECSPILHRHHNWRRRLITTYDGAMQSLLRFSPSWLSTASAKQQQIWGPAIGTIGLPKIAAGRATLCATFFAS
jgi:hypothetical protein